MEIDREDTIDGVVIVMMVVYGFVTVGTTPIRAISAWLIGGLLLLRHVLEPYDAFVDQHEVAFLLLLLAILGAGFFFA